MKKRLLALSMAMIMVAGSLSACNKETETTSTSTGSTTETAATTDTTATGTTDNTATGTTDTTAVAASDEGSVLNIYVWNEEFKSRLEDHYPGYEKVDATTGKIGDVTVNFIITPTDDNAYQNNLDEALLKQANAAADDKVDIFLIEADYALKYVDTPYTMSVADLGISASELADQYKYTQDVMTDANGVLKGVSWQGCPAGLIYNRAIATEVLGTDDPAEVQKAVADWATFNETAVKVADAGYLMTATVNDSYRVYSNNVTSKWVDGTTINIDPNLVNWVNDSKAMVDAGQTTTAALWSDDWSKGFFEDAAQPVFCYFGPAWFFDFCMHGGEDTAIATNGGWAITEGPQGFFWGGTWIAAADGTDNPTLVADIMRTMTADDAVMKEIAEVDGDFVNNRSVVDELAADASFGDSILGGQNYLSVLASGADSIDLSNLSAYDQGCNEEFQGAMKNYFDGNATYDEALEQFYKAVEEKYPELSH